MNKVFQQRGTRKGQSGAAAIEFAFVLPLLLAVTYGGVVYGYVFMLQQSIDFAAQQGAQAAVATVPSVNGTAAAQLTNATTAAKASLGWLPTDQFSRVNVSGGGPNCIPAGGAAPAGSVTVEVTFTLGGTTPLFPVLDLPMGIGAIPPLPATLNACAVAYT
ncbi:MAG: TadE/TadG family type IV pilus assembly protein [Nevskia sp.]|nr:TadE/TadG family type IV pilus assembly protein [Nevskia sp.]